MLNKSSSRAYNSCDCSRATCEGHLIQIYAENFDCGCSNSNEFLQPMILAESRKSLKPVLFSLGVITHSINSHKQF